MYIKKTPPIYTSSRVNNQTYLQFKFTIIVITLQNSYCVKFQIS